MLAKEGVFFRPLGVCTCSAMREVSNTAGMEPKQAAAYLASGGTAGRRGEGQCFGEQRRI